jgi:hypothetical protein
MSRSVRQDFDVLRTPHHVYARKGDVIGYIGVTVPLSDEQLFTVMAIDNPEYERKAIKTVVAATPEDWALYHQAKRGLLAVRAYEGSMGAEEVEIPCPKPRTEYHFLETVEEWLARCRTLREEQKAA